MSELVERIGRGEILVGDGAWGTQLMARGAAPSTCMEAINRDRPELLAEIARAYVEAGADLITTNSFGASPVKLASVGLEAGAREINRAAVTAIREITAGRASISASVGPTGAFLKPYGELEPETLRAAFEDQIGALTEAGAQIVCIETMSDLAEATLAVEAARSVAPAIPVIATMTFDATPRGFFTMMGVSVEQAAKGLEAAGADLVGSNCGNGIEKMVQIAREMRAHTTRPLAIQSNAGLPQTHGSEVVYPEDPEFMATHARALPDLGVALIGGCCGTTPDHIRALRAMVDEARPARS